MPLTILFVGSSSLYTYRNTLKYSLMCDGASWDGVEIENSEDAFYENENADEDGLLIA